MLEKNANVSYGQIYNTITKTSVRSSLELGATKSCGGVSNSAWPNNVFGHGRIDALNSVKAI